MLAEIDIQAWLAQIEDTDLRRCVAELFAILADVTPDEESDPIFTPFVYPH